MPSKWKCTNKQEFTSRSIETTHGDYVSGVNVGDREGAENKW